MEGHMLKERAQNMVYRVPASLRARHLPATRERTAATREALEKHYFKGWRARETMPEADYARDLHNHLESRLRKDRVRESLLGPRVERGIEQDDRHAGPGQVRPGTAVAAILAPGGRGGSEERRTIVRTGIGQLRLDAGQQPADVPGSRAERREPRGADTSEPELVERA